MNRLLPVALLAAVSTAVAAPEKVKDYVCDKEIVLTDSTPHADLKGVTFFFCSEDDLKAFEAAPEKVFEAASTDYAAWVAPVYEHYFAIRKSLASDTTQDVCRHAARIAVYADAASKLTPALETEVASAYGKSLDALAKAAAKFPSIEAGATADIEDLRTAFQGLSEELGNYAKGVEAKEETPRELFLYYCPMAKACWAQESAEMGNPYFGETMLTCGEAVDWRSEEAPKGGGC